MFDAKTNDALQRFFILKLPGRVNHDFINGLRSFVCGAQWMEPQCHFTFRKWVFQTFAKSQFVLDNLPPAVE